MSILDLEPKSIWQHFNALNAIPRPSKKEEKIIEFMLNFGNNLGLKTEKDEIGNILIIKPASKGMENKETIVLQAHLDMVCQKNNDTIFDFNSQGIQMRIENEWVKANGTTLGADNGLGVATIMALLSSNDIPHPKIEALFTIDEETGMTGALQLKNNWLKGKFLLNLDTEDDDEITIGCAGGIDISAQKKFYYEYHNVKALEIKISGLQGGHSGIDIHKGFGNANKILARLLTAGFPYEIQLLELDGGSLRNAIPREAKAIIKVNNFDAFEQQLEILKKALSNEYQNIEKNLNIQWNKFYIESAYLNHADSKIIIQSLNAIIHGVFRMSPDVPNLVEASNNLARISLKEGLFEAHCLARSSVESTKQQICEQIQSVFELANIPVTLSGSYIGWQPNMNAKILQIAKKEYEALFGESPKIVACHAGLECGIIGGHYPQMEMISFGPTIKGAHSPDERVNIASVNKFWLFLQAILKNIPDKKIFPKEKEFGGPEGLEPTRFGDWERNGRCIDF